MSLQMCTCAHFSNQCLLILTMTNSDRRFPLVATVLEQCYGMPLDYYTQVKYSPNNRDRSGPGRVMSEHYYMYSKQTTIWQQPGPKGLLTHGFSSSKPLSQPPSDQTV